jgi:hypothetical protein
VTGTFQISVVVYKSLTSIEPRALGGAVFIRNAGSSSWYDLTFEYNVNRIHTEAPSGV